MIFFIMSIAPWVDEVVQYPDADQGIYENEAFAFMKP